jgi:hypothetical protein
MRSTLEAVTCHAPIRPEGRPRTLSGRKKASGGAAASFARPAQRARRAHAASFPVSAHILGKGDGQHVPGCADGEPEHRTRPRRAHAARRNRPPQRGRVRHRAAREAAAADLSNPVPGPPLTCTTQVRQPHNHRQARYCTLKPGADLS